MGGRHGDGGGSALYDVSSPLTTEGAAVSRCGGGGHGGGSGTMLVIDSSADEKIYGGTADEPQVENMYVYALSWRLSAPS